MWPPESDSAGVVVERLLKLVDAMPELSAEALAERILTGSPVEAQEAVSEAHRRSEEEGIEAPDALQREFLPPFLEWTLLGGPRPWPSLDHSSGNVLPAGETRSTRRTTQPDTDLSLLEDSLPAWVLEPWVGKVRIVDREAWLRKPARQGGTLQTMGQVVQWGPFVRLSSSKRTHMNRQPDQAPRGWARGRTFLLLRTEDGWVVVSEGAWET